MRKSIILAAVLGGTLALGSSISAEANSLSIGVGTSFGAPAPRYVVPAPVYQPIVPAYVAPVPSYAVAPYAVAPYAVAPYAAAGYGASTSVGLDANFGFGGDRHHDHWHHDGRPQRFAGGQPSAAGCGRQMCAR